MPSRSPEHLLPTHIGGEFGEKTEPPEGDTVEVEDSIEQQKEARKERQEALRSAPTLESVLEAYLKEKGVDRPKNLNLSLIAIEEFQRYVHEAQDLRNIMRESSDPDERREALKKYGLKKKQIDEYIAYGASFEDAYREYVRSRNSYVDFVSSLRELSHFELMLAEPSFQSLPEESAIDDRARARLEMLMKEAPKDVTVAEELEALKSIYDPQSREYKEMARLVKEAKNTKEEAGTVPIEELMKARKTATDLWADPLVKYFWHTQKGHKVSARTEARLIDEANIQGLSDSEREKLRSKYESKVNEYELAMNVLRSWDEVAIPKNKAEVSKAVETLKLKVRELWDDPMVRYFWQNRDLQNLLKDFASGEDVLETPSVIGHLNELHEWETQHQRTTIGGVLVGPPGVGKTTLVRHYLEQKGRDYVYIDLSEDVTRYLLYGSKSLEFKDPLEHYEALIARLGGLDEKTMRLWISENAEALTSTFGVKGDEVAVTLIAQVQEVLETQGKAIPAELASQMDAIKQKVVGLAEQVCRKELAGEFGHLVKHNGWRDGVVISALRRGDSIIMDEFNKNKNWSLVYGLMTAKPGEKWYFADNDEYIEVPADWRMYFTANIGRKHGGFAIAEALASRAAGKVMEVNYPAPREEMQVALASLANPEGDFLRPKEDLAKLFVLIHDAFPGIRALLKEKSQSIPISFRTLRDLGEKLILYRDAKSGKNVYEPTKKTFDEALYDIVVESYGAYEDKTTPKEVVRYLTSIGLLLDDKVKTKVLQWIDEASYDDVKKKFEEHKEDFNAIVEKIRGLAKDALSNDELANALPVGRNF